MEHIMSVYIVLLSQLGLVMLIFEYIIAEFVVPLTTLMFYML